MALKHCQQAAIQAAPDSRRMIAASGDNSLSIRRKLDADHQIAVASQHRQQAAIRAAPNSRCMIAASGNNSLSIRGKLDIEHGIGVTSQHRQQAAIRAAPDPRCMIMAGSDDALAIGGKCQSPNLVGVALKRRQKSSFWRTPYPRRLVNARGRDQAAIRRKRGIADWRPVTEDSRGPPDKEFPNSDRVVGTASHNLIAGRGKSGVIHLLRMASKDRHQAAVLAVPNPRRPVKAGGCDVPSVRGELHVLDRPVMPHGHEQATVLAIPYSGSVVKAGRGDPLAIT
jgi:hypothetical protein